MQRISQNLLFFGWDATVRRLVPHIWNYGKFQGKYIIIGTIL